MVLSTVLTMMKTSSSISQPSSKTIPTRLFALSGMVRMSSSTLLKVKKAPKPLMLLALVAALLKEASMLRRVLVVDVFSVADVVARILKTLKTVTKPVAKKLVLLPLMEQLCLVVGAVVAVGVSAAELVVAVPEVALVDPRMKVLSNLTSHKISSRMVVKLVVRVVMMGVVGVTVVAVDAVVAVAVMKVELFLLLPNPRTKRPTRNAWMPSS